MDMNDNISVNQMSDSVKTERNVPLSTDGQTNIPVKVEPIEQSTDIKIKNEIIDEDNEETGLSYDAFQEDMENLYKDHVVKDEMVIGPVVIQDVRLPLRNHNGVHVSRKKQINLYQCKLCNKLYSRKSYYDTHMRNHASLYECDHCHKRFNTRAQIYHHIRTHMKTTRYYDHVCEICNKRFHSKQSVDFHHLKCHAGELKDGKCGICTREFTTAQRLIRHITEVHTSMKRYSCDKCVLTYKRKLYLDSHIKKCHSEDVRLFACNYCEKTYAEQSYCNRHMKYRCPMNPNTEAQNRRKSLQEKIFTCNVCHKTYRQKDSLTKHYAMQHTGLYSQYQCDICSKMYTNKHNLRTHIQFKHMNSKIHCEMCSKVFGCRWSLTRHLRNHSDQHTK